MPENTPEKPPSNDWILNVILILVIGFWGLLLYIDAPALLSRVYVYLIRKMIKGSFMLPFIITVISKSN